MSSSTGSASPDRELTVEEEMARREEEDHQAVINELGFDPDFDPDDYVPPNNAENCIDTAEFNRRFPSILLLDARRNLAAPEETLECSICMCEVEDNERVRVLSCKHAFHVGCIDPWVTQKNSICPLCRKNLLSRWKVKGISVTEAMHQEEKKNISIIVLELMNELDDPIIE